MALLCAYGGQIPVFGSMHVAPRTSLLALGFLVLTMCLDPVELRFTPAEIKRRTLDYAPRTARERLLWIAVSLFVAVSEEIAYRAVLFGIFHQLTGNYWVAGIISAMLFAIAHRDYGVLAAADIFFVGLGLQYLVQASGGLYYSIVVHFIHNFLNGIIYGALRRRQSEHEAAESPVEVATEVAVAQQPD